jgi:Sulfotransferase domain
MRDSTRERLRAAAPRWMLGLTGRLEHGGVRMPPAPPVCPSGWRTGPPDFVGVGVQRGGTTRWFDLITSHPEVAYTAREKELHYFDRFYASSWTADDVAGYHAHFPRDEGHKVGEWTPMYMSAPWIPRLLAAAAPDTRLLVSVRDPVERFLSGLEHDARIAEEARRPLSQLAPYEACMRGFYHAQLTRLLAYFDRSQILILQYERCVEEPLSELRRTFEFLGLKDTEFAPDVRARLNASRSQKQALDPDTLKSYVEIYRDDVTALIDSFPEIDVRLWPNFAHLAADTGATLLL